MTASEKKTPVAESDSRRVQYYTVLQHITSCEPQPVVVNFHHTRSPRKRNAIMQSSRDDDVTVGQNILHVVVPSSQHSSTRPSSQSLSHQRGSAHQFHVLHQAASHPPRVGLPLLGASILLFSPWCCTLPLLYIELLVVSSSILLKQHYSRAFGHDDGDLTDGGDLSGRLGGLCRC